MDDLSILDITLAQLGAVQNVARHQFYLTTEELRLLLDIDHRLVDPTGTQVLIPQFQWRNFVCTWVEKQGRFHYWHITL